MNPRWLLGKQPQYYRHRVTSTHFHGPLISTTVERRFSEVIGTIYY